MGWRVGTSVWTLGVGLVATGCAHTVPLVPTPAPVEVPTTAPATSAIVCWAEYARSGAFTASGLVVRRPDGVVLVDAGQSLHFRDELAEVDSGRFYLRLVPGALVPDRPAVAVLAEMGVAPEAVLAFVPTHAHSDHLGGLVDLPDVPVRMHPAELGLLEQVAAGGAGSFNVIPAEARRVLPEATPLAFVDAPIAGFARSADLLGDGSVVVVPLEGHTPGSVGVLVHTGDVRILTVGDALNTRDQLGPGAPKGKSLLLRRTDADRAAADHQVGALASLRAADPELVILPAHERDAWVDLFGEAGGCVGGRDVE